MKEPARTINKGFCFKRMYHLLNQIAYGSLITIPNSLKQFPVLADNKGLLPDADG